MPRSHGASTSRSWDSSWPTAAGGDAVALFMRFVGTPDDQVEVMRQAPFWPGMEAIAPTLAYDHAVIIGERWSAPAGLAARVSVPALVIAGEASLPFMPHTARALSQAMPQARLRMLEGQTHNVNPGVLAPSWWTSSPRDINRTGGA